MNPSQRDLAFGARDPQVVISIDGGARGNPGPAGFGVRVERPDGTLVEEFSESIGIATNNVAEYRGLLAALEWAERHGHTAVHIRSDSLLLVQQMLGKYKVRHAGLLPLHAKAQRLVREIGHVTFEHVARASNAHADRLANEAMDGAVASRRSPVASRESPVASAQPTGDRRQATSESAPSFTWAERAVRRFIYRHFVDTARAPDSATIAAGTRLNEADVTRALLRLADAHALVLAPASTNIWMAHPFSAVPSAYPVTTRARVYWANCAWDAAGVLSLVGDGECRTRCADCGVEIVVRVRSGHVEGDGVVHYAVPPRRFWENVAYT